MGCSFHIALHPFVCISWHERLLGFGELPDLSYILEIFGNAPLVLRWLSYGCLQEVVHPFDSNSRRYLRDPEPLKTPAPINPDTESLNPKPQNPKLQTLKPLNPKPLNPQPKKKKKLPADRPTLGRVVHLTETLLHLHSQGV